MIEPEYHVRQLDFETWEVAKFEASDSPTALYKVVKDVKGKLRCDCPRWLRKQTTSCKHCVMVQSYINKGPNYERTEEFLG